MCIQLFAILTLKMEAKSHNERTVVNHFPFLIIKHVICLISDSTNFSLLNVDRALSENTDIIAVQMCAANNGRI